MTTKYQTDKDKMETQTSTFVWKKEWDMGISDEELIKVCDEVLRYHEFEKNTQVPDNSHCEEATFDTLLDMIDE